MILDSRGLQFNEHFYHNKTRLETQLRRFEFEPEASKFYIYDPVIVG